MSSTTTTDIPVIPGAATIVALINFIEQEATTLVPEAQQLFQNLVGALKSIAAIISPAVGREDLREIMLSQMLANKDLTGLLAFYNTVPKHPNKSLAICAADIKLLGGTVPA